MSFNANKLITTPIDAFTLLILWAVLVFLKMSALVTFVSGQKRKDEILR